MFLPRIRYLTLLGCCIVYYFASGEWLSCFLLLAVGIFPLVCLVLSLPAMLQFRIAPTCPDILHPGEEADALLMGSCPLPMPPFRGRLRLTRCLTGESWRYQPEKGIPTDHCGGISLAVENARVCDYLGLIAIPVRFVSRKRIRIYPQSLPPETPPDFQKILVQRWKPKVGGGFSENHELRPYRPGDPLNQVHWKLSAKTGDLILREAMEPVRGTFLLTLTLKGTEASLDRALGNLLWLGKELIGREIPFTLRCLTGEGILDFQITDSAALQKALDRILCSPCAQEGDMPEAYSGTDWHYHIGGDPDEA